MYFRGKRSKLGAKISFAFLLGVFSTGCGLSWNDEATHSDSFEVRSDLKDCGQDFDRKVADYFEGKTSAQEMLDLGECADKALSLFLEHHRGEKENAFSVEKELYSSFIKRYFLGETEVPKSLRKALKFF